MNKKFYKYGVILLLIILFAAPGIAAYLMYSHPEYLGASKTNRGNLLNPPIMLPSFAVQNKWKIVFWTPSTCDILCLEELDTLARVRLALGRTLYEVDLWLVLSGTAEVLSQEAQSKIKDMDFQVATLSATEVKAHADLFSKRTVFLTDPNNYLILSYPSSVNPDDVYHDLKLLINTTKKNG